MVTRIKPSIERATRTASLTRKGYLNLPRTADMLQLSIPTVRKYVAEGWLRHRVIGNRRVIMLDEIKRFQEEGKYQGGLEE